MPVRRYRIAPAVMRCNQVTLTRVTQRIQPDWDDPSRAHVPWVPPNVSRAAGRRKRLRDHPSRRRQPFKSPSRKSRLPSGSRRLAVR